MKPWYHDLLFEPHHQGGDIVVVERLYCLRFPDFSPEDWDVIGEIYRELPGWLGSKRGAFWFGEEDDEEDDEDGVNGNYRGPHVHASVEIPGLQVYGVLPIDDWIQWTQVFDCVAMKLPYYEAE